MVDQPHLLALLSQVQPTYTGLSNQPLFGIALTVVVYWLATQMHERLGRFSFLNPTLVTIVYVAFILVMMDIPYASYMQGGAFLHFLLGVAVVVMAVPLYQQAERIKGSRAVIAISLAVGIPLGMGSGVAVAWWLGADATLLASLAPRSMTAGVASTTADQIGGIGALTGILAVFTGITGALLGPRLFRLLKIHSAEARGLALGISAHGIGAARAAELDQRAGAFATLAMVLTAVTGSILLPIISRWM